LGDYVESTIANLPSLCVPDPGKNIFNSKEFKYGEKFPKDIQSDLKFNAPTLNGFIA